MQQPCAYWSERGQCRHGDQCRYSHSGPRGQVNNGGDRDQSRRLFDKFTKDKVIRIADVTQARKFAEAVEEYSEGDLPWRLTRRDECGLRRIKEAIMIGGVGAALCIIRALAKKEYRFPEYEGAVSQCWKELYMAAGVFELLTAAVSGGTDQSWDPQNLAALARMAVALTAKGYADEQPEPMLDFAQRLKDVAHGKRGSEEVARLAQQCLKALGRTVPKPQVFGGRIPHIPPAQVPGGRHENDFRDFRQISVMPTLAEVTCTERPFLPRCEGEAFLQDDPDTQLLDRHFRLLREDMMEPLRTGLAEGTGQQLEVVKLDLFPYEYTIMNHEGVEKTQVVNGPVGLVFLVHKEGVGSQQLLDLLQARGQLTSGNLVLLQRCLSDGTTENVEIGRVIRLCQSKLPGYTNMAEVSVRFPQPEEVLSEVHDSSLRLVLSGGSFFAYEPVLTCLQQKLSLHFQQEFLLDVTEPLPLERHRIGELQEQLRRQFEDARWQVDAAQQAAFQHATSHRVSLVVGPPGTGKSFVGVELALALLGAGCGPLLVVCYTNHALDDFLGRILDRGYRDLVRLGSRSKDERMESLTLQHLARNSGQTAGLATRRRVWDLKQQQAACLENLQEVAQQLRINTLTWRSAKRMIVQQAPHILSQLQAPRDDDFFMVGRRGKALKDEDLWKAWVDGRDCPLLERVRNVPWCWSPQRRRDELQQWTVEFKQAAFREFRRAADEYDSLNTELSELHRLCERAVLANAKVIGATTTGAAKYMSLIAFTGVRVMIMEESGEVLEAHCHTSLSESIEHLIMIGDHKQLRPKVESHALTVAAGNRYDLNRSLFERLILGNLSHSVLEVQHRMRPEISAIARHMTYPALRDGERVLQRPHVLGLAADIVFIDHAELEQGSENELFGQTLSKVNGHEADVCVQIVRFLLAHGYGASDLVVLTPYLGQLKLIKDRMRKANVGATVGERDNNDLAQLGEDMQHLQDDVDRRQAVRVSTVDNYQGEEADIVVASLVRSNVEGRLGFLGKADAEQRVNVLCTRARCGLILIGNAKCLENAPLWKRLLGLLRQHGQVFDGLPVKCHRHGVRMPPAGLRTAKDLKCLVDHGAGCQERCDRLLDCGHACPLKCHPFDDHDKVACRQLCPSFCRAGLHRTRRVCSEASAPPCTVLVVEQCDRGHPVVRECRRSVHQRCRICLVLASAEEQQDVLAREVAERKVELLTEFASETCRLDGAVEASVSTEAQLRFKELVGEAEQRRQMLEEQLARALQDAERQAGNDVQRAYIQLEQQKQDIQEKMTQMREDTEHQLQGVATRIQQRQQEARESSEALLQDRDRKLQELHDELQRQLDGMQAESEAAGTLRPDMASIKQRLDEVRGMALDTQCGVCMDDCKLIDGVLCRALSGGHFLCCDCFKGHVRNEAERQEFQGEVRCPFSSRALGGCTSKPYPACLMAAHAPDEFQVYNKKCLALREAKLAAEMEQSFNERLERAKAELQAASEEALLVNKAREHIIEKILTLRCPRCSQAFLDFEGCFALTCSRQSCHCAFCAHCLKDCGSDAHACAAECGRQLGMSVFGRLEEFENCQRSRRRRLVNEYLERREFQNGLGDRVRDACRRELHDLRL